MMREILLNGSQFQSTLPRRERRKDRVQGLFTHSFQSTLPRRERRYIHVVGMRSLHFNPRSREGSDLSDMATSISISPFQSTLPRRERQSRNLHPASIANFNPRSREGSDEEIKCEECDFYISIHAPAKGATLGQLFLFWGHTDFNPRSREGSDLCEGHYFLPVRKFQSTLPRRERRFWLFFYVYFSTNFNPRSREGSDAMPLIQCLHRNISIHAPAKGATCISALLASLHNISIHAPAKGATFFCFRIYNKILYFNPRSREGSDISFTL